MVDVAEIAYEAYRAHTGGVSLISGHKIPPFRDLAPEIKAAWQAAADAIVKLERTRHSPVRQA